ncbi:MAG TPA: Gfo/Idh/MocA family oxidoreductase [Phycisphaerales bacterium]|nr:Gfo/Idh/MocA family oxidoreductase [Phycisphaerales bacterium]
MIHNQDLTRRDLIKATAAAGAVALTAGLPFASAAGATGRGAARLKVGVIGCGGRGTGAAMDILSASDDTELWAMGDALPDRLEGSLRGIRDEDLTKADPSRVNVDPSRMFSGFDAYKGVIASGVDVVILATAPAFRPIHLNAAVKAGKHVFMEKPVAVCPAGVRSVLASAAEAKEKKLNIVTGTQRRHERCYLEAFKRIGDGALGPVVSASVYWNQGGLWMHKRRPEWSDVEWQLRNWLYFTWLSGDHICEQHVHNLDVAHWAMGATPVRCTAVGGRQVRTSPDYGHIFDHFGVEYEYADGRSVASYCRQIDGCASRVEEVIRGVDGQCITASGRAEIRGKNPWKFSGDQENPYVSEHKALVAGITGRGPYINEGERIAHSTMMAVMGRMSAYTGKSVSWKQAIESKLDLRPSDDLALGSMPAGDVAAPGRTQLI